MPKDGVALVRAVYNAYACKDRQAVEALLSADYHFTSPLDNNIDRKTYFERCWPNSQHIEAFEFVHLAQADDLVFVTYVCTTTDHGRFRNTEVFALRGDQITNTEVYFGWSLPHTAPRGGFTGQP